MIMRLSLSAAALLMGLGIASAQQAPAAENAAAQNNEQAKPMQNGTEEPGSHPAAPADTSVFVNGKLAVPGAPADSETVPAKFSERNARLDDMPTMALPLWLTDEQKQRIAASVAGSNAPVQQISAKLADVLPATTPVSPMPADVKADAPMASDLQFIRTRDKILLVRAPNMIVTGEIAN